MNLKNNGFLSKIVNIALDIFYPQTCIMCNSFVNTGSKYSLCSGCRMKLGDYGKVIRDNDKYFEEVICALPYTDHIKDAMTDYKFHNVRFLYKTFAYAIFEKIKDRAFLNEVSLICPVPIHPYRDRAYNQSLLMADYISELSDIENIGDLLIKIQNIKPLSKMGYRQRKHFVKSAIAFNIQYNISGKTICLVDDIFTTGSTVNECSRILRMYGAKKVYVLAACYATDKNEGESKDVNTNNGNNQKLWC